MPETTAVRPDARGVLHTGRVQCSALVQTTVQAADPAVARDSEARSASPCSMLVRRMRPAEVVCLFAACAQPTGADPIILMVETYSERADAIQNMAIKGSGGTFTKPTCPQSESEVRT